MRLRSLKIALWLAAFSTTAFGDTLVVPAAQATAAGNTPITLGSDAVRIQEVIGSGQFTGPVTIIGLRIRAAPGTGSLSSGSSSFKLTLSTTQAFPNTAGGHALPSITYASNVGPDATVVYDGPRAYSSPGCAAPGPCPFDMVLAFTTPFSYDPSKERLLIDYTTAPTTGAVTGKLDGVTFSDSTSSSVALVSGDPAKATGNAVSVGGIVLGLDTGTSTYYFPHLAFAGGWQTTVTYVNYSPQNVACQTTFYTDSGTPLLIPFGGTQVSSRGDFLASGADLHEQTTGDPATAVLSGWAVALCSSPIKASVLFRFYNAQGVAQGEAGPHHGICHLRADTNGNRVRQPIHHVGHGYRHCAEFCGTNFGKHGISAGAECSWCGQPGSAAWAEQLHGIGADHVDGADRQPVVERRSLPGLLSVAAR